MVVVGAPVSYLPRASIGQEGRAPIIRRCCAPDDVTAGLNTHPVRRPDETAARKLALAAIIEFQSTSGPKTG